MVSSVASVGPAIHDPDTNAKGSELSSPAQGGREKSGKVGLALELLLHGVAMALAIPLAKAADFGGAIPVMFFAGTAVVLSFFFVRIVKTFLTQGVARTAVMLFLPIAYIGVYLALYVAIRS